MKKLTDLITIRIEDIENADWIKYVNIKDHKDELALIAEAGKYIREHPEPVTQIVKNIDG